MKKYYFQIIAALIALLSAFMLEVVIEFFVETPLDGTPYKSLSIPLAVLFGLIVNIVLLLNFDLVNKIPGMEKLLSMIQGQSNSTQRLFESLEQEDKKLQKIFNHLHQRNNLIKAFGTSLVNAYLEGFQLIPNGYHLIGEYWALKTNVRFWEYLSALQENKKNANDSQFMIARVTHSNDISVWIEDYKPYRHFSHDLYWFQEKFIKNGGKIIRMLIGPTDTPNEDYQKVIHKMESIGIEVKYFSESEVVERDFDFLYLADEKIVLKWFSGASGKRIARCTIEDRVEDEVRLTWNTLFYKALKKGNPVKSIPKDREHDRLDTDI